MIPQWKVGIGVGTDRIFEIESEALKATFEDAWSTHGATLTFPDGREYVVIKRHPLTRIHIVREV